MLQQVKCGQSKFKSINQNMSKTKNKSNEIHHKTPFAPKKKLRFALCQTQKTLEIWHLRADSAAWRKTARGGRAFARAVA
jgi:hypothetical protein